MTDDNKVIADDLRCGLIMPISPIDNCSSEHWEEVRSIIRESLKDTNFKVELVSDSNEVGVIQNRIVSNIYKNDIVICDVSGKNPNVMFELGMRLAFDKPAIIIKDDKTNYSFDTAPIEHLEYPRDLHYQSIVEFKNLLKKKVIATYNKSKEDNSPTFLTHFGDFKVSKVYDKEVSSDEYIVNLLKELKERVYNIEKQSIAQKYKESPHLIFKREIEDIIDSVIDGFKKSKGIHEFAVKDHRAEIIPVAAEAISAALNVPMSAVSGDLIDWVDDRIAEQEPF